MSGLLCCPFCESGRLENLDDQTGSVMCIDCRAVGPMPGALSRYLKVEIENGSAAWMVREGRKPL